VPNALAESAPPRSGAPLSSDGGGEGPGFDIARMRNRVDFLRAGRGRRVQCPGLILQARKRGADEPYPGVARVGFTCSKKIGRAVVRNRAKRRLREISRALVPQFGEPGWDYVLVGRANSTAARPYLLLLADLEKALRKIHSNSGG